MYLCLSYTVSHVPLSLPSHVPLASVLCESCTSEFGFETGSPTGTHLQKQSSGADIQMDRSPWVFEVSGTDCIFVTLSANTFWVLTFFVTKNVFLLFCCHLNLKFDEISKGFLDI